MALKTISLAGGDWKQNYYRAEYEREQHEYDIHNLHMSDGLEAGAHGLNFDDSNWISAVVPGDIRDGLINAGQMPDPYFARNSDQCRWVENFEWWLRREVLIPDEWANMDVSLVFDGVDYLASYYWDGEHLGDSSDMFVSQRFRLGAKAKPGWHVMAVRLSQPPKSSSNHFFDGAIPSRAHHHKMQCSWGWDWTRELVSIGIWDDVKLEADNHARLSDVFLQAFPDGDGANIKLELTVENQNSKALTCDVEIFDPDGLPVASTRLDMTSEKSVKDYNCRTLLSIKEARLWWPTGYGEQAIYTATFLLKDGNTICDRSEEKFGIRKIEMLRNPGSPDEAYPLTFSVNGQPIFACGANWVPADMLPGRMNEARYEHLLRLAAIAGFNMLRVWGGGLIEKRAFYSLCDRFGIMVWQEFPLSCSNYPQDSEFLEAKRVEAEAVIKKLRNHPCISLWCGGNEMQYYGMSPEHPVLKLFGDKVAALHPGIGYHLSSPDKSRPGERDHGPWGCHETHSFWNNHFRHFTSEFGCNAPPAMESLLRFIPVDELEPSGPSLSHHFCVFEKYDGLKAFDAQTTDEKIFYSQLVQAELLQYAMGVKRSQCFTSSGCLIWQFNSAWPEGGWGIVDYHGVPKMSLYWLAESTAPQALIITDNGWELNPGENLPLKVHAINGLGEAIDAEISLEAWGQTGQLKYKSSTNVKADAAGPASTWDVTIPADTLADGIMLVRVIMSVQGREVARSDRMFAVGTWRQAANSVLPASLAVKTIDGQKVTIKNVGETVALVVRTAAGNACFDANCFNLLPGESRTILADSPIRQIEVRDWTHQPAAVEVANAHAN